MILGFWRKTDTYMEYPDIHFKQELLFVAELEGEGEYLTYSTYQTYNVLQQDKLRVPVITVSIWAATWQNQQNDMSVQSDQRLYCALSG